MAMRLVAMMTMTVMSMAVSMPVAMTMATMMAVTTMTVPSVSHWRSQQSAGERGDE